MGSMSASEGACLVRRINYLRKICCGDGLVFGVGVVGVVGFGGGDVRVFNVFGVCVVSARECGGWCVLAAVVVLVLGGGPEVRYCRARVHVACARPRGAQTFFWG